MPPTKEGKKKKKVNSRLGAEPQFTKQGVYVAKIHKSCNNDLTISQAALGELNRIVDNITTQLTNASRDVMAYTKGETLNQKVIEAAGSVVLSGNLKRRALRRASAAAESFKSVQTSAVGA
jgi:hypothetical protein